MGQGFYFETVRGPGGYTTSTSITPPTIPIRLRHLVGHLRYLQHLPQAQAGLPPTSRSLSIFDVPHASKFVSSQHVSYFVAICCNTMQYHHTTSNRLFKAPVTVEIHSVTFSNFFACRLLPMDWCGHTRALSGYPLQTSSNMVESCYVMLGYVRLYEKMSKAVNCFRLKTLGAWKVFSLSDFQIKSIQLHSTQFNSPKTSWHKLQHWSSPACIQGRPRFAGVTLKKRTQMLRWKLFPVDQWIGVDKNISGNIQKPGNFTIKHRGLLQNCICRGRNKINKSVSPTFTTEQLRKSNILENHETYWYVV